MPDLYVDPAIREIQGRLDRQANEIVALKGAIASRLAATTVSETSLKDFTQTASKRPPGFGNPDSAADTIEFFKEVIIGQRANPAR